MAQSKMIPEQTRAVIPMLDEKPFLTAMATNAQIVTSG
jgi:hypothetical protein